MQFKTWRMAVIMLSGWVFAASAQRGPQDNFVLEPDLAWGSVGSSNGQFSATLGDVGMAFDGTNLFVVDFGNSRIQVFDKDGVFVRKWGSSGSATNQLSTPAGLAVDEANVYVSDKGNSRIQVFSKSGTPVRRWGIKGSATGQFINPNGIAVDKDRVYVADSSNNRIQVFDKNGVFQFAWGSAGAVAGQFNGLDCLAVDSQYVYAVDTWNHRLQVFDKSGNFVRSWPLAIITPDNGLWTSAFSLTVDAHTVFVGIGQYQVYNTHKAYLYVYDKMGALLGQLPDLSGVVNYPEAIAVGNPMSYLLDTDNSRVLPFRRYFRTLGTQVPDPIPLTDVLSVNQRNGVPTLDVDYLVTDPNDATVTVYAAAFVGTNATLSVTNLVPMRTFVEGTATNIGPGIATGKAHRLSWDMEADGVSAKISEWGNLKTAIMAKDSRGLLDLHFLSIPSIGTNAAFKISRDALSQADLLPLWFWLAAAGDSHIALVNGQIKGVDGTYTGSVLASGTNTTDLGRAFLFERVGVRDATATELKVAREGSTPGTVVQRDPRRQPPAVGYKVNQFNFVTYPTNGWWIVPLTP